MIDFNEHVQINDIKESAYNPRVITPEALVSLQESLQRFGMIKPLIVNNANWTPAQESCPINRDD